MSARNYTNTASQATTTAFIDGTATSVSLSNFSGFPVAPFAAALERGTATEEIVLVTAVAGSMVTITRGWNGTTAKSHPASASFQHVAVALDFSEANAHLNTTSNVHGLSSKPVGESDTQSLTNKTLVGATLTSPTITGPTVAADVSATSLTSTGALTVLGSSVLKALTAEATAVSSLSISGGATKGGVSLATTADVAVAQAAGQSGLLAAFASPPSGRVTSVHWGSGTTYPSAPQPGDTYLRTDLAQSLMRWNGASWRQTEIVEIADPTARAALSTSLLHRGFEAYEASTKRVVYWDGAQWVKRSGPVEQLLTGFPLDQGQWQIPPGQTVTTMATAFTMPIAGNVRTFVSCMWGAAANSAGFFSSYVYPQGQAAGTPYVTGNARIHNLNTGLNVWSSVSWGGELFVPAGGQVVSAAFSTDGNGSTMGATQTYVQVYF